MLVSVPCAQGPLLALDDQISIDDLIRSNLAISCCIVASARPAAKYLADDVSGGRRLRVVETSLVSEGPERRNSSVAGLWDLPRRTTNFENCIFPCGR